MTPARDLSKGDVIRGGAGIGVIDLVEVTPQTDGWVHLRWGFGPYDTRIVDGDSKFMVVAKFVPVVRV